MDNYQEQLCTLNHGSIDDRQIKEKIVYSIQLF